jgi:hypothetical protein
VGSLSLFVAFFCVILSMYGGGFSTIPAYLADLFGTKMVAAIHGRLLTAWATAGVLGPALVNYIREYQIDRGVPRAQAYSVTMYVLAGLLVVGLICNLLVTAVAAKHHMTQAEIDALDRAESSAAASVTPNAAVTLSGTALWVVVLAWIPVAVPLAWGIWVVLQHTAVLFGQG